MYYPLIPDITMYCQPLQRVTNLLAVTLKSYPLITIEQDLSPPWLSYSC